MMTKAGKFSLLLVGSLFLSIGISTVLSSQSNVIIGLVQDEYDASPISGVHISYNDGIKGVTSNVDGVFQLRIDNINRVDSVTFSHIGFRTKNIAIHKLMNPDVIIFLEAAMYETPNVVIQELVPEKLIARALSNIERYFHSADHMVEGFYREQVVHEGKQELLYLAEGELEVYKSKYLNNPTRKQYQKWPGIRSHVALKQGEILADKDAYEAYSFFNPFPQIINGPRLPISLDIFKGTRAFLSVDFFEYFDYEIVSYEQIGGENYYLISFTPIKGTPLTAGFYYYNADKEIITGAEYHFDEEGIKRYNKSNPIDLVSRVFKISYRPRGGKYTLDHILVENLFSHKILGDLISNQLEFITTSIDTVEVIPLPLDSRLRKGFDLNDFIKLGKGTSWDSISLIPRSRELQVMLPEQEKVKAPEMINDNARVKTYSVSKALKDAKKQNKIALLIGTASWCVPCKSLKQVAFKDEHIIELLNDYFIVSFIDGDRSSGDAMFLKYNIRALPTVVAMLGPDNELGRHEGYRSPFAFYNLLMRWYQEHQKQSIDFNKKEFKNLKDLEGLFSDNSKKREKSKKKINRKIKKGKLSSKEVAKALITTPISDLESESFAILTKNKNVFLEYYDLKKYTDKILVAIISDHFGKRRMTPKSLTTTLKQYQTGYRKIIYWRFLAEHHQYVNLDKNASENAWLKYFSVLPKEHFEAYDDDLFRFISSSENTEILLKLKEVIVNHNFTSFNMRDHILQINHIVNQQTKENRPSLMSAEEDRSIISRYGRM